MVRNRAKDMKKSQSALSKGQSFGLREIAVGLFRHKFLIFITLLTTAFAAATFCLADSRYV